MELGKRIRVLRKRMNMTQEGLGRLVYLSRQSIGNIEAGRNYPSLKTLDLLALVLKVDRDYLLYGENLE